MKPFLRSPRMFLLLMTAAVPLAHNTWRALLNNFAVEQIGFNGFQIGILQSIREVPGLLAFSMIGLLLLVKEQRLALLSLFLLGLGVAATGYWPTARGFYLTTFLMSIGFHYYEALEQSLTLQFVEKEKVSSVLGQMVSAGSLASIIVFAAIWIGLHFLKMPYASLYLLGGAAAVLMALFSFFWFPNFSQPVEQKKSFVLKKKYWLYYALVFLGGARRQIFVVFAGFFMVEKFGFSAANIALLFLLNHLINLWIAPKVGRLIFRIGEKRALLLEYGGLVLIFTGYAIVTHPAIAALLYLTDNLFFSLSFALKSYFKQIADAKDFSATSSVSSTINHVIAVFAPISLGMIWLKSSGVVFLIGAFLAGFAFLLALLVPSGADREYQEKNSLNDLGILSPKMKSA